MLYYATGNKRLAYLWLRRQFKWIVVGLIASLGLAVNFDRVMAQESLPNEQAKEIHRIIKFVEMAAKSADIIATQTLESRLDSDVLAKVAESRMSLADAVNEFSHAQRAMDSMMPEGPYHSEAKSALQIAGITISKAREKVKMAESFANEHRKAKDAKEHTDKALQLANDAKRLAQTFPNPVPSNRMSDLEAVHLKLKQASEELRIAEQSVDKTDWAKLPVHIKKVDATRALAQANETLQSATSVVSSLRSSTDTAEIESNSGKQKSSVSFRTAEPPISKVSTPSREASMDRSEALPTEALSAIFAVCAIGVFGYRISKLLFKSFVSKDGKVKTKSRPFSGFRNFFATLLCRGKMNKQSVSFFDKFRVRLRNESVAGNRNSTQEIRNNKRSSTEPSDLSPPTIRSESLTLVRLLANVADLRKELDAQARRLDRIETSLWTTPLQGNPVSDSFEERVRKLETAISEFLSARIHDHGADGDDATGQAASLHQWEAIADLILADLNQASHIRGKDLCEKLDHRITETFGPNTGNFRSLDSTLINDVSHEGWYYLLFVISSTRMADSAMGLLFVAPRIHFSGTVRHYFDGGKDDTQIETVLEPALVEARFGPGLKILRKGKIASIERGNP